MDALPFIKMFSGKTKVTFIHATTGDVLGTHKINPDQLPLSFNRPVNIEFNGATWRVIRAVPVHAKDYILDNKLTLHVEEAAKIDPRKLGFPVPTICNDQPGLSPEPITGSFILEIVKEEWRQLEFLPSSLLQAIQKEMPLIEAILYPAEETDALSGYKNMHTRNDSGQESLLIPVTEFCQRLNVREKGVIRYDNTGFIQNGIAIRSDNYTYYGIEREGILTKLCLHEFDSVDEEFCEVAAVYDQLLADWCNGRIIMS